MQDPDSRVLVCGAGLAMLGLYGPVPNVSTLVDVKANYHICHSVYEMEEHLRWCWLPYHIVKPISCFWCHQESMTGSMLCSYELRRNLFSHWNCYQSRCLDFDQDFKDFDTFVEARMDY